MNRDWLHQKYIVEELTCKQISELTYTSYGHIQYWLVAFNIPRRHSFPGRKMTEETKRKISERNQGVKNGKWKGDDAGVFAGNLRARGMYQSQFCSLCGKKAEIHHKDGNTLNNELDNIEFLCRKHHMERDGRMLSKNQRGRFITKKER